MTFEEAEKFEFNPFDVTKVRKGQAYSRYFADKQIYALRESAVVCYLLCIGPTG